MISTTKKLAAAIAVTLTLIVPAFAVLNIEWYVGYGIYPNGAADTASTTGGTGLLANNGSGQTIIQLVWVGNDGVIGENVVDSDKVNPANAANGYVEGDDVVIQEYTITSGVNGYDEWVYTGTVPAAKVDPAWTAYGSFVYARVFQDTTPAVGEWYFDSPTVTILNKPTVLPGDKQSFQIESGSDAGLSAGVALNQPIVPEPSVLAFLGIGSALMVLRRMRRA